MKDVMRGTCIVNKQNGREREKKRKRRRRRKEK